MGKRKGNKRSEQHNNSSQASDNESQASSQDHHDDQDSNASVETQSEEKFEEIVENIGDKRAFIRIQALNQLNKILTKGYEHDTISEKQETLALNLLNSIKKGTSEEVTAACRATGLCVITIGESAERFYTDFAPTLQAMAKDPQKNTVSRVQVIGLLGLLCFVACTSDDDTRQIMSLLSNIFTKTKSTKDVDNSELIAQSLESWGLLATTLSSSLLASEDYQPLLGDMIRLLEDESVDVRVEAGEDIAILYTARLEHLVALADDEAEHHHQHAHDNHEQEDKEADDDSKTYVLDRDHLIDLLQHLSTDGNRFRARKDRAKQRSSFRDILKTVENGQQPLESMTMGKDKHEFEGWSSLRRLDTMRIFLGTGFQLHMSQNPLLGEVFGLDQTPQEEVSEEDVRRARQENIKNSKVKARSQFEHNAKQRRRKQITMHALSED